MKKTTIGKTGYSQTRQPTAAEQKGFDPSRSAPETQVERLNRSIKRDLDRLAGMVRSGRYDLAAERTVHVARNIQTIRNLATMIAQRQAEPATEAKPTSKRAGTSVKVKQPRLKRWSEK